MAIGLNKVRLQASIGCVVDAASESRQDNVTRYGSIIADYIVSSGTGYRVTLSITAADDCASVDDGFLINSGEVNGRASISTLDSRAILVLHTKVAM